MNKKKSDIKKINEIDTSYLKIIELFNKYYFNQNIAIKNSTPILKDSTKSISSVLNEQATSQDKLKDDLEELKELIDKKSKDIKKKDTQIEEMKLKIKELEKIFKNLEDQNKELKGYVKATKDAMEMITKQKVHINVNQIQTQKQIQKQYQIIDIKLYLEILNQVSRVEKDLEKNPEKYRILSDEQKEELNDIISDIKKTGPQGFWSKLKKRVKKSKLYKFVKKPENQKKLVKLAKLLGTIALMAL